MKKVGIKTFHYAGSYPAMANAISEKLAEAEKELGKPVEPVNIDEAKRLIYYSYEE